MLERVEDPGMAPRELRSSIADGEHRDRQGQEHQDASPGAALAPLDAFREQKQPQRNQPEHPQPQTLGAMSS